MGSLRAILKNPDDLYPLIKLKLAARHAEKQIPPEPHWGFCYSMLHKVSRSFALVIQQLPVQLRDAVCIFYLVLRALDTVEDDTSIPTDVKVPILISFHQHVYDREWHFSCGTKEYKVLMDQFRHVSTAFLELGKHYQQAIEDITMKMGAGMAKFICKEVETTDDYDEYCHYVAGLVGLGLSKLFHASGKEDLASDSLSNSMGLFLQKTNIIRDYLEDINEVPKCRMFWPREIWSKYVNKLEDLKYEENSDKAVQCLNDMVTNSLSHVEDCLTYMYNLRDPAIFRFCAIPQVMAIGTLAMCYDNIEVFRGVVKMRRGLTAKVIDRTRTMADVYGAFFDFSCMLKSKVNNNDPNATKTLKRLEAILKTCRDSGTLNKRKSYVIKSESNYSPVLIVVIFIILAIILAQLSGNRS
ncbi:squalene synthase [Lycium ferocissimum]|uniref:squalene synthase n=1 Tax=Lycium ferocissimum TaxID=112874 RepID=UPI0028162377|nr:squalene synthase [Lycium ferocissimum]